MTVYLFPEDIYKISFFFSWLNLQTHYP